MFISSHLRQIEEVISKQKNKKIDINLDSSLVDQFEIISEHLKEITKPVLYWFECKSLEDAQELKNLFIKKKTRLIAVPPVNDIVSKVLYLGVRQGGIYKRKGTFSKIKGRIYHHFGLYKIETTQGLKLEKWAIMTGKTLKLNIIEFDIKENQYLYILEKLYALELKPMFGKH